jgi:hypothetical protein
MSRPLHPPSFNHPNNIRWRIQVMKFIIMQFSPRSVFSRLGPNILLTPLFSKTLSLRSSPNVRDHVSRPYSGYTVIRYFTTLYQLLRLYSVERDMLTEWTEKDADGSGLSRLLGTILTFGDSSVSVVTRLRAGRPQFNCREGQWRDFFSSPPHPDRFWRPSSLLSNGYSGLFPLGGRGKRPGRKADH